MLTSVFLNPCWTHTKSGRHDWRRRHRYPQRQHHTECLQTSGGAPFRKTATWPEEEEEEEEKQVKVEKEEEKKEEEMEQEEEKTKKGDEDEEEEKKNRFGSQ